MKEVDDMVSPTAPRRELAVLPTPVHPLPNLSRALGGPELWIKRDDLTGLALGGNKTRKLERLLAEAQAQECQTLITRGAVQSNHCRQTAAAAAAFGFDCVLVLGGEPPAESRANLFLDQLFGAELVWTEGEDPDQVLRQVSVTAQEQGRRPYLIPYGGSSPLGAAAYADALEELLGQGPSADLIIFATSSGGTQAGLLAGAQLTGFEGRVYGISVDPTAEELSPMVLRLANQTLELLGAATTVQPGAVHVDDRFLGAGYAVMGDPEREAILAFAGREGILLDPVYTGRAAAGMLSMIRHGEIDREARVLFWHTGGTPALFAYEEALLGRRPRSA